MKAVLDAKTHFESNEQTTYWPSCLHCGFRTCLEEGNDQTAPNSSTLDPSPIMDLCMALNTESSKCWIQVFESDAGIGIVDVRSIIFFQSPPLVCLCCVFTRNPGSFATLRHK